MDERIEQRLSSVANASPVRFSRDKAVEFGVLVENSSGSKLEPFKALAKSELTYHTKEELKTAQ